MRTCPADRVLTELYGLSNFDHSVGDGLEAALRDGGYTTYAGWNFYGEKVWFEDAEFHCEVWVYGTHRETVSADSLAELMEAVSSEYGHE